MKATIKLQKHSTKRIRYITSDDKKKLLPETLKYQLDLHNRIWKKRIVPEEQKSTITNTPIKKNPKGVRRYRPVGLTNILIFINITKKRLVWYLEKKEKWMADSLALESNEAQ